MTKFLAIYFSTYIGQNLRASRDGVVGIVTRLGTVMFRSSVRYANKFFSSPKLPDRLLGPNLPPSEWIQSFRFGGKTAGT
jgi:hypothetical protein